MIRRLLLLVLLAISPLALANPTVTLHTTHGDIVMELYPDKAPVTVENFLQYARDGFFEGTIFHRSIRRFVIQGGGFTADLEEKPTRDPIINEADNGLTNDRWTVSMARTSDPNSATSQFFINVGLNLSLDRRAGRDGYAVFGKVIDGQSVVREINNLPTHTVGFMRDVPKEKVIVERVSLGETSAQ
ncbi:cyclophilin family peptidyl-prolyl cis-trans isomerase [Litorivivens lipolytica]|uniref:Peptidyl-prolyl cis-trans isomerase n=1 Tax=Litorivivens lipolytica TaxID=1524264 RepID=A0A7W4W2A2_9GAMM|nr:peptidylprolyl isomerase [Litorivivens lipolytica]MBB3046074.1 cyclophilin family peptidyl-prolyl cis-trans isomerase [Litorivivens lipolytica]